MKHLNRFLILMANLKCNKCERKAEVETKSSLLCTSCWYKDYVTLSRKETQNYGIRPLNRDYDSNQRFSSFVRN
jgi:hypothetical protein